MLRLRDFSELCKKSGLNKEEVRGLYKSFRKTAFFGESEAGRHPHFSNLEKEYQKQKSILEKIDLSRKSVIADFVRKAIEEEKEIYQKSKMKDRNFSDHVIHRLKIDFSADRIEKFMRIASGDIARFHTVEAILAKRAIRARNQALKKTGVIIGLSSFVVGASLWMISKFSKDTKEEKKESAKK